MGNYIENIAQVQLKESTKIPDYVSQAIVMRSSEDWLRTTIRKRWLMGKRPDGNLIGIYASRGYAGDKYAKNPLAGLDHVDLTLTGSLGKKIKVSLFGGTEFEIYSTDEKFMKIADAFGDVNFNLSPIEQESFFNIIGGFVIDKMSKNIY